MFKIVDSPNFKPFVSLLKHYTLICRSTLLFTAWKYASYLMILLQYIFVSYTIGIIFNSRTALTIVVVYWPPVSIIILSKVIYFNQTTRCILNYIPRSGYKLVVNRFPIKHCTTGLGAFIFILRVSENKRNCFLIHLFVRTAEALFWKAGRIHNLSVYWKFEILLHPPPSFFGEEELEGWNPFWRF